MGQTLGELLLAFGETASAHEVLTVALAGAVKLGLTDSVDRITELLGRATGEA